MTVDSQESPASERIAAAPGSAPAATIESLRARLLSERAASKEARQQAEEIAEKVSELQTRLELEIENRKKAEIAMEEVLEVLKAKGLAMEQVMATTSLPFVRLEYEDAVLVSSSSKEGDSEHSSSEEASHSNVEVGIDTSVDYVNEHPGSEHGKGSTSEDDDSCKARLTAEEACETDSSEVEKEGLKCDDSKPSQEQVVMIEWSEEHGNGSLLASQATEKDCHRESSHPDNVNMLGNPVIQGLSKAHNSRETSTSFAKDIPALPPDIQAAMHLSTPPPGIPVAMRQEYETNTVPNAHLSGGDQVHAVPTEAAVARQSMRPQDDSISMPGIHNQKPKNVFMKNGPPCVATNTYNDKHVPGTRRPVHVPSVANASRDGLFSEVSRYSQPPLNESLLTLVDDKNGKLGNILMALNLAKQQLQDEDYTFPYVEEKLGTSVPMPTINGSLYAGFYGEGPHLPPYHLWRPEAHNQAPIIHFPVSPTSDHEFTAFERHDGLRRSSSGAANYGFEGYLQPKGELHLGNGITLYTD